MDADRGLVEAAAGGSREAFDELVRRHQTSILNLVRALTAGSLDAEDLTQEVFVRAWTSLAGFRGDSAFRTWLHTVALNVIQTHRGRMSRWRRLFRPAAAAAEEPAPDPVESARDPADLEKDLLMRDSIDHALGRLPEELRVAVTLRDIQGLDYKAIAELSGVPIGTVESRIYRARQRLRKELTPL